LIGAVVLAAGAASRFGRPKQVELLPAVLERLAQAEIGTVVVVEGAHELPPQRGGPTVVHCADWADGPGASLRCGLGALPAEATHALVVLADGPLLDPRAVARLAAHAGDADVVAASYDGTRSHPVSLARTIWDRIPPQGARALRPTLVDCSDLRAPGDIDTEADLEGLEL
jgi:CTP:molybdopterin cytidylyltransferase MocA